MHTELAQLVSVDAEPAAQEESPPSPAPLLPVAIGVMLGIIADYYFPRASLSYIAILICGVACTWLRLKWHRVALFGLIIGATALGAMRHHASFWNVPENHIVRYCRDESTLVTLAGRVINVPNIVEPRASTPRAYETGPRTKFILDAWSLKGKEGPIPATGRVSVSIKAPLLELRAGDAIHMTGWLYRPSPPKNPGEFDYALAQRRNGILVGFSCEHAESVHLDGQQSPGISGLLQQFRIRMTEYLLDDALDEDDAGSGVIEAMVLGRRDAVQTAMNDAFVRTGCAHFLAASGMNIAWLALMGLGFMRLIKAHYRTTAIVIAVMIVSYVLLAEPEPSIMRAGIVGLLGCFCILVRGRASVLNWLACSAVVVLLIDPCDLFRAGFQLTFIAVLAVMHVSRVVRDLYLRYRFVGRSYQRLSELVGRHDEFPNAGELIAARDEPVAILILRWLGNNLVLGIFVSIACVVTTAPLSCYIFNKFAPWGILGTLALWIPAFLATLFGYAKVVLGLILPSSATMTGPLLAASTKLMVDTVEFLSHLPFTLIDGRSPSLAWVLCTYAVIVWRTYRPQWLGSIPHRFKIATLIIVAWWLIPPRWVTHDAEALQVWMLALGDGGASVIELPDGKAFLFDCGTRSTLDAGNTTLNFLQSRGIKSLDAVFVSHADFDHYGGIERLVRELHVGRLILNDQFEPFVEEKSTPWRFLHNIRECGVPIETTHGPTRFFDSAGVVIETLWPPAVSAEKKSMVADNDRSTVLRISYEGHSILLTGDIAEPAIRELVAQGLLKADVLALPHHGSVVASTSRFVNAAEPAVCVRSTGQRQNRSTNGIEKLVGSRQYFNTADDGCVLVRIAEGRLGARALMTRQ